MNVNPGSADRRLRALVMAPVLILAGVLAGHAAMRPSGLAGCSW
jgi:hypothetical protein